MPPKKRTQQQLNNLTRIASNEAFLRLLHNTNSRQRKELIRTASKDQILSVCECAFNILRKNVELNPYQIKQLRKAKRIVYTIADKKVPVAEKKKKLEQTGGGAFIPLLLAPIVSGLVGSLFDRLISKT
jgi:hypothetical protein